MKFEIPIPEVAPVIAAQLLKGIFLCTGGETPNVMTVGWGGLAYYWRRDVFVAPIRPQRFTHSLLQKEKVFTLCIPQAGTMEQEIAGSGTLSGRDGDKFQALSLKTRPGKAVNAPIIDGCAVYLECRVLAEHEFAKERTDGKIVDAIYPEGDFHTLFYGEVVACYPGQAK